MHIGKPARAKPSRQCPQHPGAGLRSQIRDRKLPLSVVARHLRLSRETLLDLMWAKLPVTAELAERIATLLGTDPSIWLSQQAKYDQWHASRGLNPPKRRTPKHRRAPIV